MRSTFARAGFAVALLAVFALSLFAPARAGSLLEITAHGEREETVGETMLLLNAIRGLPAASPPITFRITSSAIPDDAVVEKITVMTGAVKVISGTVVVESYCLKGPGMTAYAMKKWGGVTLGTAYSAAELGSDAIPVKGEWNLYFTGHNISTLAPGSVSHRIPKVKIHYRYTTAF